MPRLVVFSDVLCPWATVVVLRLHAARARAGLDDELAIVHRALPLELLLERPVARRVVDAEIPLCASLTPDFGWSLWQGRPEEYPSTSLLAAEAIQAAAAQSTRAAEQLDLALRRAFFAESRCISLRHEVLAAASSCPGVDLVRLTHDLDAGAFRGAVTADFRASRAEGIPCSGTVVLPDGTAICNPGTTTGWIGGRLPRGTPVLLADDPAAYDRLVGDACGTMAACVSWTARGLPTT
jgi:predicted DsbA family dithiol-disulfide isomerase